MAGAGVWGSDAARHHTLRYSDAARRPCPALPREAPTPNTHTDPPTNTWLPQRPCLSRPRPSLRGPRRSCALGLFLLHTPPRMPWRSVAPGRVAGRGGVVSRGRGEQGASANRGSRGRGRESDLRSGASAPLVQCDVQWLLSSVNSIVFIQSVYLCRHV